LIGVQKSFAGAANPVISQTMTHEMLTPQRGDSGLGFNLAQNPLRFGHNGSNVGFDTVTVAFAETGQGAVFMMNANTDIEILKNILVEAVGEEYHWPGYPSHR
jgi:hypothetical protein